MTKMTKDDTEIRFWLIIPAIVLTAVVITWILSLIVSEPCVVRQPSASEVIAMDEWQDIAGELRGIRIQLDRLNSNIEKLTDKTE